MGWPGFPEKSANTHSLADVSCWKYGWTHNFQEEKPVWVGVWVDGWSVHMCWCSCMPGCVRILDIGLNGAVVSRTAMIMLQGTPPCPGTVHLAGDILAISKMTNANNTYWVPIMCWAQRFNSEQLDIVLHLWGLPGGNRQGTKQL